MKYITFESNGIHFVAQVLETRGELLRVRITRTVIDPEAFTHLSKLQTREQHIKQGTQITIQKSMARACKPGIAFRFPRKQRKQQFTLMQKIIGTLAYSAMLHVACTAFTFIQDHAQSYQEAAQVSQLKGQDLIDQQIFDAMEQDQADYDQMRAFAVKKVGSKRFAELEKYYVSQGWDVEELVGDLNTGRYEQNHGYKAKSPNKYQGQNEEN